MCNHIRPMPPPSRMTVAALLFTLTAGGCNCEGGSIVQGGSSLAADASRLDFGRVFIGTTARRTFVLSAPGLARINYSSSFRGDAYGFTAGPAVGQLLPNGSVEMVVTFEPQLAGARQAQLVVDSDAATDPTVEIELVAEAVTPPDCEDGNGCTTDRFNLETGQCEHAAARLPCDDFNACTVNDTCVDGVCLGESASCDDGDICTDDLCDPQTGCENLLIAACNDGNPCTADTCNPLGGCSNEILPDGTPCDDLEQCTTADICLRGQCLGVPEVDECDDGDPCSLNERCVDGTCLDPNYTPPGFGDLKFATDVGPLQLGAGRNPIVDRNSTVFVGIEDGVAAVDECGDLLWTNDTLAGARFSGAVSLPGILSVPAGAQLVDVDTVTGAVVNELDLAPLFAGTETTTTGTVTVRILDLALRASGALVASVVQERVDGEEMHRSGLIAEVDRSHTVATQFRDLGERFASRLAVDRDEAVVAIVSDGLPDKGLHGQQVIRFGIDGLPDTTWSSTEITAGHTDLALGQESEVLWTAGLLSITKTGSPSALRMPPEDPLLLDRGAPTTYGDTILFVEARARPSPNGPGLVSDASYHLVAAGPPAPTSTQSVVRWQFELPTPAARMTPVVDLQGNVFVATADGTIYGFDANGDFLFSHTVQTGLADLDGVAPTLTPKGVIVVIGARRVFGIQSIAPLGNSSWPRHRRDNFATGHR